MESIKPTNASSPLVSMIPKQENETFVTQRGGKLFNESQPPLPAPEIPSLFESKRTLQSTLLLQKKKEMQNVQIQLEKKRLQFAKRMEECREKQEELRAKQKQIRDRVLKFEKFLKENDSKRQRANIKAQTERKTRESKEMELIALHEQLSNEQVKSEKICRLIRKHKIYEEYLQSVVDSLPGDYLDINEPHINDILMRHKTLLETNEDLNTTVQSCQDDIEQEQNKLTNIIKEKNDMILVYNSSLGNGQKKLEKLKGEVAILEQRIKERDNTSKERMRILGEAKLAISNLFNRVSKKIEINSNTSSNPSNNLNSNPNNPNTNLNASSNQKAEEVLLNTKEKTLSEKLHAIQDRIIDLQLVIAKVDQLVVKEKKS